MNSSDVCSHLPTLQEFLSFRSKIGPGAGDAQKLHAAWYSAWHSGTVQDCVLLCEGLQYSVVSDPRLHLTRSSCHTLSRDEMELNNTNKDLLHHIGHLNPESEHMPREAFPGDGLVADPLQLLRVNARPACPSE